MYTCRDAKTCLIAMHHTTVSVKINKINIFIFLKHLTHNSRSNVLIDCVRV